MDIDDVFRHILELFIVSVVIFYFVGYILCIYKFISSDFKPSYEREIIYGGSMFLGIGGVVGWFNIKDIKYN